MNKFIGEVSVEGISDIKWNQKFGEIRIPMTFQIFSNDTLQKIIQVYFIKLIKQANTETPVGKIIQKYYKENKDNLHIHDVTFTNQHKQHFTILKEQLNQEKPFSKVIGCDNLFSVYICNH
tara:strand:+ start:119 stop:481 length:363 start_codon:yes stop_codon:yes gene_type:complete